jgi:hypothetical protein
VEPTPTKDIALAVMAGSGAIASILLVFVGFMMMKVESLPGETSDKVIRRYVFAAQLGLIPIIEQTIVMGAVYAWLFYPTNACLSGTWKIGFPVGLILFLAYAIYITMRMQK